MPRVEIGAISEGTLRECDLIPCFLREMDRIDREVADRVREDFAEVFAVEHQSETWEQTCDLFPEQCEFLLERLFAELDLFAPEGLYFGATEGDGACFGFWPNL